MVLFFRSEEDVWTVGIFSLDLGIFPSTSGFLMGNFWVRCFFLTHGFATKIKVGVPYFSMKSWLFNRDPYFMVLEIIPRKLGRISSPRYTLNNQVFSLLMKYISRSHLFTCGETPTSYLVLPAKSRIFFGGGRRWNMVNDTLPQRWRSSQLSYDMSAPKDCSQGSRHEYLLLPVVIRVLLLLMEENPQQPPGMCKPL